MLGSLVPLGSPMSCNASTRLLPNKRYALGNVYNASILASCIARCAASLLLVTTRAASSTRPSARFARVPENNYKKVAIRIVEIDLESTIGASK